jgi:hypothetical protein
LEFCGLPRGIGEFPADDNRIFPSDDAVRRIIRIHPDAPPKPAFGAPCNGCGVCCASEPCPVGVLVSRRRHGACAALVWEEQGGYRCGMLVRARQLRGPEWLRRWAGRAVARLIAAGQGCDCDYEVDVDTGPERQNASS